MRETTGAIDGAAAAVGWGAITACTTVGEVETAGARIVGAVASAIPPGWLSPNPVTTPTTSTAASTIASPPTGPGPDAVAELARPCSMAQRLWPPGHAGRSWMALHHHALTRILCTMTNTRLRGRACEPGSSAAPGYTGAELLRLLAGHPEIEVVHVTADSNAGAPVTASTRRSPAAYPGARVRPPRRRAPRRPRRRLPRACRTASRRGSCRTLVGRVGHVVDLGADFRLPGGRVRAVVRRGRTPRRELLDRVRLRPARAVPRRPRARRRTSPRRAATRPPRRSRSRRCSPPASSSRRASSSNADVGHLGPRAAGCRRRSLYSRGERERRRRTACSTTATPARSSTRSRTCAGAAGAGAVHAAPRADDPRHPRHVLPPARRTRRSTPRRCSTSYRELLRRRAVRASWSTSRRRPRRRSARTRATSPSATTPAPAPCSRSGAIDNLVKGASGQAIQAANRVLGLPETTGLPDSVGTRCRERARRCHCVAGSRPPGSRAASSRRARPTSRSSRPPTARPCAAAGVFTTNLACAAPVQVSRAPPRRRRTPPRWCSTPATPTPRPASAGRADARRMCELAADGARRARRPTCSCAPPVSSASRCRWRRIEAGIPKLVAGARRRAPTPGTRAAEAILTTDTVRKEAVAVAELADGRHVTVGGMAKGAAMLAPAMATMLAVAHHRRGRRRPPRCTPRSSARSTTRSTRSSSTAARAPTTPCWCWRTARAGNDADRHRAATRSTRSSRPSPRSATSSPRRWRPTPRAPRSSRTVVVRGARSSDDDARRAARAVAAQPARAVLALRRDPYWGRVLSELGASGAFLDPERVDIAYNGITVCRDGIAALARRDRAREVDGRRATSRSCATCTRGRGEAAVRFTDLTPRLRRREHGDERA